MILVMLDRDGVINYDSIDYIKSPDEWHEIPGSLEAIAKLNKAGFKVGVATNQSGIGRGYYNENTLEQIHSKMLSGVEKVGGCIDKIVYCPHLPDAGCDCRKPKPGLLKQLADYFDTDTHNLYYIGDKKSDVMAARACGAIPLLIKSDVHSVTGVELQEVQSFDSLADSVEYIIHGSR